MPKNTLFSDGIFYIMICMNISQSITLFVKFLNSSALLKDKVARRELNDRIEAIYEIINTKFSDVIENTEWFTNNNKQK